MQVYQDAFENDATFKAARALLMARGQDFPIAFSYLLPQLTLTGSASRIHTIADDPNLRPSEAHSDTIDYQKIYNLNATQTLFNYAQWAKVKNARANVKQAVADYNASFQDLLLRTATAYFDVLNSSDNFHYKNAQEKQLANKLAQYKERYKVGLISITDVYQTQSDYQIVVAERIDAQNTLEINLENLRVITGKIYPDLKGAGKNLPLISPNPQNIERWTEVATRQNYNLLSSYFGVEAAKENIGVQLGQGLPVLNAYGNYNYQKDTDATVIGASVGPSRVRTKTIGLDLNYPIFQGGLVLASTRQANYLYQRADAEKERVLRDTIAFARQSYLGVISSIGQVKAYALSIISSDSALKANEAGYLVGTKTILDVLTAQSALFEAQSNRSKNQYAYLINTLKLKQAAGTLSVEDLQRLNRWLNQVVIFRDSYLVKNQMEKNTSTDAPEKSQEHRVYKKKKQSHKKEKRSAQVKTPLEIPPPDYVPEML